MIHFSCYFKKISSYIGWLLPFWLTTQCFAQSVLITEIMADPTPSRGLPTEEYLELYNPNNFAVSIKGITLTYGTQSVALPDSQLQAKSYTIMVRQGNEAAFLPFGRVISLPKLSLLNSGTKLVLRRGNEILHEVNYSDTWYKKGREEGFSLEMIDVAYPCVEASNWTSSVAEVGGTPGKPNAVAASNPDTEPPKIITYEVLNSYYIVLTASEKLASKPPTKADFALSIPTINIDSVGIDASYKQLTLRTQQPLPAKGQWQLTATGLTDCSGNVAEKQIITIGEVELPTPGELVINEILVNPRLGGHDFIEIYNGSNKRISLKNWVLATRDKQGDISSEKIITQQNILIAPGEYKVLTVDAETLQEFYPRTNTAAVIEMPLPAYANTEGVVVLLSPNGEVYEQFNYTDQLHHPLLKNADGVSLERIRWDVPTQEPTNWQSAAEVAGFATPGFANSQQSITDTPTFSVEPAVFMPMQQVATFSYQLAAGGQIGTLEIFDSNGRLVRQLLKQQSVGSTGQITWDGATNSGQTVAVGIYVAKFSVFASNGTEQTYWQKVVVGSNF